MEIKKYNLNLFIPYTEINIIRLSLVCIIPLAIGFVHYFNFDSREIVEYFFNQTQYISFRSLFLDESKFSFVEHYFSLSILTYLLDVFGFSYLSSVMVGLFFQRETFEKTGSECLFDDGMRKRGVKKFMLLFVFSFVLFL